MLYPIALISVNIDIKISMDASLQHSGKSATIRESNHGVCKEYCALYYVHAPKTLHSVSLNWRMENLSKSIILIFRKV